VIPLVNQPIFCYDSIKGDIAMREKCYGGNKISYVVTKRNVPEKRYIRVFVFHENESMSKTLKESKSRPSHLLKRYDAFQRSSIAAQKWLAKVMKDHWEFFESDDVNFRFVTFKR
jgi:hypothetical protein